MLGNIGLKKVREEKERKRSKERSKGEKRKEKFFNDDLISLRRY